MDIYTEFIKDVEKYISDKLPDIPVSTKMEIVAYAGTRSVALVNDAIRIVNRKDRMMAVYRKGTDT